MATIAVLPELQTPPITESVRIPTEPTHIETGPPMVPGKAFTEIAMTA